MQFVKYLFVLATLIVGIFGRVEIARNEIGDDLQDSETNMSLGSDDLFFGLYLTVVFGIILLFVFAPVRN